MILNAKIENTNLIELLCDFALRDTFQKRIVLKSPRPARPLGDAACEVFFTFISVLISVVCLQYLIVAVLKL